MAKYKVKLEYRCKQTFTVEADDEDAAQSAAAELFDFIDADLWDSNVEQVDDDAQADNL